MSGIKPDRISSGAIGHVVPVIRDDTVTACRPRPGVAVDLVDAVLVVDYALNLIDAELLVCGRRAAWLLASAGCEPRRNRWNEPERNDSGTPRDGVHETVATVATHKVRGCGRESYGIYGAKPRFVPSASARRISARLRSLARRVRRGLAERRQLQLAVGADEHPAASLCKGSA